MPALSRSGRIILLLGLNIIMFLAEIIVGYKTSSLALIADAFHMLSDVLSQIIALYAIRVKTRRLPPLLFLFLLLLFLGANPHVPPLSSLLSSLLTLAPVSSLRFLLLQTTTVTVF